MPRLTEEIRRMIGLQTPLQRCCDVVEAGAVRRHAQAVMDGDPIYMDAEYVANTRYGTPVAPALFPLNMLRRAFGEPDPIHTRAHDPGFDGADASARYGLPPLPIDAGYVNGAVDVEVFRYAHHGEEVYVQASYEDIVEKETSNGWMLFVHYDCKFMDSKGELILRLKRVQIRR